MEKTILLNVEYTKKTYLYCTPALSNGHGSCTFHFQHQSLHGKNSRGGIALTPSFCVHNFFQSIQYRKCIVRFDRSRDPNIFYQNNLLKNDDNFICICNLMNKINYILLGVNRISRFTIQNYLKLL